MRRPPKTPNTLYALEATEYAQQQGQFDSFHHAAYKALWADGKDLGDLAVIRDIAEGCGLSWPELGKRLESGYYRDTVLQQFQEARELSIQAIPTFLVGNLLFSGAQPYEVFEMVMKRVMVRQESP